MEGWETPAQMFSAEIYKIFKNTQVVTSESLGNDFSEQMFTLKLSKILPRTILKKKIAFHSSYHEKNDACAKRKGALGTRLANKIIMYSS